MATLWIREYENVPSVGATRTRQSTKLIPIPIAQEPGTDQTPVTFSTSVASAAFASTTQFIAIIGSAAFHYIVAADPTATTAHLKWPADLPHFIGVEAGLKIAVIAAA